MFFCTFYVFSVQTTMICNVYINEVFSSIYFAHFFDYSLHTLCRNMYLRTNSYPFCMHVEMWTTKKKTFFLHKKTRKHVPATIVIVFHVSIFEHLHFPMGILHWLVGCILQFLAHILLSCQHFKDLHYLAAILLHERTCNG